MEWDEPEPVFEVQLNGPRPFGFRVTGGKDYRMPLRIALVRDDTTAAEAQLQAGLRILSINDQPTSQMTQKMAKDLVKSSPDKIQLMIQGAKTCTLSRMLSVHSPLPAHVHSLKRRSASSEHRRDPNSRPSTAGRNSRKSAGRNSKPASIASRSSKASSIASRSSRPSSIASRESKPSTIASRSSRPSTIADRNSRPSTPDGYSRPPSITEPMRNVYNREPMTVPSRLINNRPSVSEYSLEMKEMSNRAPVPLPGAILDLPDEKDSGYSVTPSIISLATEAESNTDRIPYEEESDPEITEPTYPAPPPPPPPPPPPLPPNAADDFKGTPQRIEITNDEDDITCSSCGGCGKEVWVTDLFVEVEGTSWHGGCLSCKVCETALFSKDYRVVHGRPVCMEHAE